MNLVGLLLDLVAMFIYANDFFKTLNDPSNVLFLLEVKGDVDANGVDTNYAVLGAMLIMLLAASKLFLPLLFLFGFGLLAIKAMWEVVGDNKRSQVYGDKA